MLESHKWVGTHLFVGKVVGFLHTSHEFAQIIKIVKRNVNIIAFIVLKISDLEKSGVDFYRHQFDYLSQKILMGTPTRVGRVSKIYPPGVGSYDEIVC